MRLLALGIALVLPARAQSQRPILNLQVEDEEHFTYSIPHSEQVRAAWIEVRDEPLLLDKKSVPVVPEGKFDWQWNRGTINPTEDPADNLTLSMWDPNGETIICDENTVMRAYRGGRVAQTIIGNREKFEADPALSLSFARVAQDSPSFTLHAAGAGLPTNTRIHVNSEEAGDCADRFLRSSVIDFTHADIEIPASCLRTPGLLYFTANQNSDNEYRTWLQIAGRHSPQLKSVEPASISAQTPKNTLRFTLRGKGFTPQSEVYIGEGPSISWLRYPALTATVKYISPTELRVEADPSYYGTESFASQGSKLRSLRFWVEGDEKKFELSEPFEVAIETDEPEPPSRPTALITAVSPFPVKLMTEASPNELQLTIRGENFRPENKVWIEAGHYTDGDMQLRSEYVSPNLIRAWLPRQLWRKHKFTYSLVVETKSGQRLTKKFMPQVEE